jgi:hypothetical protein
MFVKFLHMGLRFVFLKIQSMCFLSSEPICRLFEIAQEPHRLSVEVEMGSLPRGVQGWGKVRSEWVSVHFWVRMVGVTVVMDRVARGPQAGHVFCSLDYSLMEGRE